MTSYDIITSCKESVYKRAVNIPRSSVQRIVKRDLHLSAFRRVSAQIISESVKQKRLERCQKLIRRLPATVAKKVFSLMKKTFTWTRRLTIRTTAFGLPAKSAMFTKVAWWSSVAKHITVSAGVSSQTEQTLNFTLKPRLIEDCKSVLPSGFIFQQDGAPAQCSHGKVGSRLYFQQQWPTAMNSLAKMNGHQTLQTLTLFIITSGELSLNATRHLIPSRRTLTSWKSLAANMWPSAAGLI